MSQKCTPYGSCVLLAFLLLSTFGAVSASATYVATPFGSGGVDAITMANTLLSGASGITLNSATYTGADQASGTFAGGASIFGIDQGVVLTSGKATTFGSNNNGMPGYLPLRGLNGNAPTFDASVLDIKFIPTGSNISFKYVFGSEEYPGFVDSQFNDAFGFFVNGTAPSNNAALIPGTSTPVAINTVNCGNSAGLGLKPHCDLFVDNRNGDKGLGADALGGWTQPFNLTAAVNPGVQNELILAIADTSDSILDSAALIQSGTFASCGGPGQPCGGPPSAVPEPSTVLFLGTGLAGMVGVRKRLKMQ